MKFKLLKQKPFYKNTIKILQQYAVLVSTKEKKKREMEI